MSYEISKHHSGGFDDSLGGTPIFILDGEQTYEVCLDNESLLFKIVAELFQAKMWLMLSPPTPSFDRFTLYVQEDGFQVVNATLENYEGDFGMVFRGPEVSKGDRPGSD